MSVSLLTVLPGRRPIIRVDATGQPKAILGDWTRNRGCVGCDTIAYVRTTTIFGLRGLIEMTAGAGDTAVPTGTLMKGKRGLIMGVANNRSIAWGIAKVARGPGRSLLSPIKATP